jgi:hypothetical protein
VRSSALKVARSISPRNLVARSAAATMSSTRNRQSRDMPRLAEDSLSEARMQPRRHDQIDATTEDLLEPVPESDVTDEPGDLVELHEQVHIAFRSGIAPRDRPEQIERSHS